MKNNNMKGTEHNASAKMTNLPISTKQSVEISNYLRYKNTAFAKKFLEDVTVLKKAVPFKRFNRDRGHKAGMAAGRYPQKAAKEFLLLVKSVEANAQAKGLNTGNLKIVKILANKASVPATGGRNRQGTKRSHIEIMVKEGTDKSVAKKSKLKTEKKVEPETKTAVIPEEKVEVKSTSESVSEVKETSTQTEKKEESEVTAQ